MIAHIQVKERFSSVYMCPFCGAFNTYPCEEVEEDEVWYFVECEDCGYRSGIEEHLEDAIKHHNIVSEKINN